MEKGAGVVMGETMTMTFDEWIAEGKRRFGDDEMNWKFKCPACGHVASINDYKAAGAPVEAVGFSCVGRWTGSKKEFGDKTGGPCNYAGGGLIRLNPVTVVDADKRHHVFEFAAASA